MRRLPLLLACAGLTFPLAGCDTARRWPVDGPYYLGYVDDQRETLLFRCTPDGFCAADALPGPVVFAAGANARYVVLARHPDGVNGKTEYYYVQRAEQDAQGFGDARRLFGPLDRDAFDKERKRLGLPDFSVTLDGR